MNIAGVPIGNIGNVTLRDGVAVVQMNIKKKYKPIYKNAQLLLRPKTGLKDMYIEMDPGTRSAGAVPAGGTIPVSNTLPDVNLDEILSNLDSDTRSYLIVLLGAGCSDARPRGRAGGPARDLQALRAHGVVHGEDHEAALATPPGPASRDPQLPAGHIRGRAA